MDWKKIFTILPFFLLCLFTSDAQYKVYGKVVTDKKEKYHGEIISYEPGISVTMNCQGDTKTFDLSNNEFKFTTRKPPKPYVFPDGIGYHRIAAGLLVGQREMTPSGGVTSGDGGYLTYTYHYQKTRLIGYGGGLSYQNYGDVEGYDFIVPGLTFMSYIFPTNTTPFIKVDAGYGIAIKNTQKFQSKAQGGLNMGLGLGYRLSTNKVMVDLVAGGRIQNANYTFEYIDRTTIRDVLFKRIEFSIGFMW